jgi:HSP20 family protein
LTTTTLAPPVDIYEDEHDIILKIEVSGIDEKDIDVSIQNNTLTVVARQNCDLPLNQADGLCI